MSLNKVTLIGNLGADPEIRSMQNGAKVASFNLATTDSWKDKTTGERKNKTEWHKIAVFSENLVKLIESYIKKGSKIYIEGALQTRKWQDKDGNERYTTEIVLQGYNCRIEMLDGKKDSSGDSSNFNQGDSDYDSNSSQSSKKSSKSRDTSIDEDDFVDEVPF